MCLCVGGSWVAPENKIKAADWHAITELARSTQASESRQLANFYYIYGLSLAITTLRSKFSKH